MKLPPVVSPAEWQHAADKLLAKEKEATRTRDALAAERRRLPMVRIDKEYVFEGPGLGGAEVTAARFATACHRLQVGGP